MKTETLAVTQPNHASRYRKAKIASFEKPIQRISRRLKPPAITSRIEGKLSSLFTGRHRWVCITPKLSIAIAIGHTLLMAAAKIKVTAPKPREIQKRRTAQRYLE